MRGVAVDGRAEVEALLDAGAEAPRLGPDPGAVVLPGLVAPAAAASTSRARPWSRRTAIPSSLRPWPARRSLSIGHRRRPLRRPITSASSRSMVIGAATACRDGHRGRAGCGRPPRRSRCRRRTSRTCRAMAPAAWRLRARCGHAWCAGRSARRSWPARGSSRRCRSRRRCRASLPATAAAEPDDEPPVTRSGAAEFTGEGKCALIAHQREGKLVGLRLAGESRALVEQHLHGRRGPLGDLRFRRTCRDCRSRSCSRRRRRYP